MSNEAVLYRRCRGAVLTIGLATEKRELLHRASCKRSGHRRVGVTYERSVTGGREYLAAFETYAAEARIDIVRALPAAHIGTRTRPDAAIRGRQRRVEALVRSGWASCLAGRPVSHCPRGGRTIECQQGILGKKSILPDLQCDSAALVPRSMSCSMRPGLRAPPWCMQCSKDRWMVNRRAPHGCGAAWGRRLGTGRPGPSPLGSSRRCMRPAFS